MSDTTTYCIPPFPKLEDTFTTWDGLVGAASVVAGIAVAHQVLDADQFANVFPKQTFVPQQNPGPPIYLSTLSETDKPHYSLLVKDHDRRLTAYNAEKTSLARFLTELLKSLPPDLRLLTEKHERSFTFTISACMVLLRKKFAVMTPTRVVANDALLAALYCPGTPLHTHFALHERCHAIAKTNHTDKASFTKYLILAHSMQSDPYYAECIGDYEKLNPRVDQQLFPALMEFLLSREGIRPLSLPATATSLGFTAAASTPGAGSTGRPRTTDAPPTRYCWSHGLTYHSGTHCKHRKPGHLEQATLQDRMGGNDKGCP